MMMIQSLDRARPLSTFVTVDPRYFGNYSNTRWRPETGITPSMQVLLVDDVPELLAVTKLLLEAGGATVYTAANASVAHNLNELIAFDVAIIDYRLGRANGAFLARDLKAVVPRLKVILTSGTDTIPQQELAFADAFYVKGYARKDELVDLLRKVTAPVEDRRAG